MAANRPISPEAASLLADPAALRAFIISERARRSGSLSFKSFVQQGWQYVPRVDPLEWNWHMDVLCDHLEEVAHGRISKLVINIPPGHAKSVFAAVLFPAWVWTWWPKCQILVFSYSDNYVRRDAERCRSVMQSEWYQQTYCEPAGWNLRTDYGGVSNFTNTAGGERTSTSTGGAGGGLRAHIIVGDDPLNISDAHSESDREKANNFIGQTISQRWVDKRRPRFVLIMQRLHEEDPSAFVLAGKDAEHVRLPAEFDPEDPSKTSHVVKREDGTAEKRAFWRDPRPTPSDLDPSGMLLFPQRFPREVIEKSKGPGELGPDGFEAQGNQRPSSFKGGMFQRIDWRYYRRPTAGPTGDFASLRPRGSTQEGAAILPWAFDRTIMTVDAAFKANPGGSRVAIHVWSTSGANRFLRARRTALMDFVATKAAIVEIAGLFPDAREKFIEDAANGPAIISDLKGQVPGLIGIGVAKYGSKTARAAAAQPWQRAHNCFLPEGDPDMNEFVATCAGFPKGKLADDVDSFSLAMLMFEQVETEAETGHVTWNRR